MTQLPSFPPDEEHVLARVADQLCRKCFDIGSDDNLSVVLVALGETAVRLTPASVASPSSVPDPLPRKLEYDQSPATDNANANTSEEDGLSSPEVLSAYLTPGHVQVL
jgi:hypothetical protein